MSSKGLGAFVAASRDWAGELVAGLASAGSAAAAVKQTAAAVIAATRGRERRTLVSFADVLAFGRIVHTWSRFFRFCDCLIEKGRAGWLAKLAWPDGQRGGKR
jgi:hypothetical protein